LHKNLIINFICLNLSACNSLTTISGWAFQNCSVIDLSLPTSIITIEQYAFSLCYHLTQIDWSANTNLTTPGDNVLWACENLNSVKLLRSVSSVGIDMFTNCGKLMDIVVDDDNPYYITMDGVLFNKDYALLIAYAHGKIVEKYIVPTTVPEIGEDAFRGCLHLTSIDAQNSHLTLIALGASYNTSLTEVILPATVTTIGSDAFRYCSDLSTFNIYNPVPPALGTNVFRDASTSTCKLYVPANSMLRLINGIVLQMQKNL